MRRDSVLRTDMNAYESWVIKGSEGRFAVLFSVIFYWDDFLKIFNYPSKEIFYYLNLRSPWSQEPNFYYSWQKILIFITRKRKKLNLPTFPLITRGGINMRYIHENSLNFKFLKNLDKNFHLVRQNPIKTFKQNWNFLNP